MDLLLSTLKKKKEENKKLKKKVTGNKRKRYVRQSEIEEVQSREYFDNLQKEEEERIKKKQKLDHYTVSESTHKKNQSGTSAPLPHRDNVMQLLREMDEPITLFGESELDRFKRLRYLQTHEVEEERKQIHHHHHNEPKQIDYLSAHEETQEKMFLTEEEERMNKERLTLLRKTHSTKFLPKYNPSECSKMEYCLKILERLTRDWEAWLILSPDEIKKSLEFKRDREIHLQCKEYIEPLFKKLRTKNLTNDIIDPLFNILLCVVKGDYITANIHFMKLSIGNSPWPMGVTNVGIHARSANEKIKVDSIAHVLNDETQRKYIQSVKRLTSFAKRKYKKRK